MLKLFAGLVVGANALRSASLKDVVVDDVIARHWGHEFTLEQFEELSSSELKTMFAKWQSDNDRNYNGNDEEGYRYLVWLDALSSISHTNSEGLSYKLSLNQFGDMTGDEFRNYIHGGADSCIHRDGTELSANLNIVEELVEDNSNPSSVDWRSGGHVTPVKNQGQCGSCWAFSTTGSLECQYSIQKGQLNSLSEQQLVDCSTNGNYGCNGGWWYNAFDYIQQNGGLCSEQEYAYTARDGTCKDQTCGTKYDPISGYTRDAVSDSGLEAAVAKGCVSVGIEADQYSFQYYSSGVLTAACGTSVDHGVTAVGYGTDGGQEYWWVKNSWGTGWGDNGYIRICKNCGANGNNGECGINMYTAYPNPQ